MATILVVDDDTVTTALIAGALSRAGHLVVTHDSGFGLTMSIHRHRPDIVILDVNMPGLNGTHALRAARSVERRQGADAKVILFSGLPQDDLARLATEAGAHTYLKKPSSMQSIIDAVKSCLVEAPAAKE